MYKSVSGVSRAGRSIVSALLWFFLKGIVIVDAMWHNNTRQTSTIYALIYLRFEEADDIVNCYIKIINRSIC